MHKRHTNLGLSLYKNESLILIEMPKFRNNKDKFRIHERCGLQESLFSDLPGADKVFRRLFTTELAEGLDHAVETQFGPDDINTYNLNSYGFRGPEYSSKNGLLALGCSQTMGMGVPEEGTWPYFLAKSLGLKYSKIAYGGWSIQTIVMNAFAYFKEFGHPEVVAILLPDPIRTKVIAKQGLIDSRYGNAPTRDMLYKEIELYDTTLTNKGRTKYPKYSKRPYLLQDILTGEHAVFYSFQMLGMLIQYCRSNNINLVWGTWSDQTEILLDEVDSREINFDLSGYVVGLSELTQIESDCHSKLRSKYGKTFDVGTDESRHMGVHSHMHIAEKFKLNLLGVD